MRIQDLITDILHLMVKPKHIIAILFLIPILSFGQKKQNGVLVGGGILFEDDTVNIVDIFSAATNLETSDSLFIEVFNCTIDVSILDKMTLADAVKEILGSSKFKLDSAGRLIINKAINLSFINIKDSNYSPLQFDNIVFNKDLTLNLSKGEGTIITFNNCQLSSLKIVTPEELNVKYISLYGNLIIDQIFISVPHFQVINIENNILKPILRNPTKKFDSEDFQNAEKYLKSLRYEIFRYNIPWIDTIVYNRRNLSIPRLRIESIDGYAFYFSNNEVQSDSIHRITFNLGELKKLSIKDNIFNSDLIINNTEVTNDINLLGNKHNENTSICLTDFAFPANGAKIYWDEFKGNKIGYMANLPNENYILLYKGVTEQELANKINYLELLRTYEQLFTVFKTNGDIESANGCYVELKDLEGRRMEYVYHINGSFRSFFAWKLNQLMKYYTEHGTDPAKSIVIAIWIILWFGVFYFFFPSDWDVTSKSKLIEKFKELINKNDKGYIKPFFNLLIGFSISLINALTLSLNSFTTLGFGNIPTHGLARYVCIIEGFMGWFLLSLFSVALINQALF